MKKIFTLVIVLSVISLSANSSSAPSGGGAESGVLSSKIEVSVYPNPAHNNVFISFQGAEVVDEVAVFDALGSNLDGITIEQVNSNLIKIQTSNLQPGVYFVRVSIGSYVQTERVVVS